MRNKLILLLLALVLAVPSLAGCGSAEARTPPAVPEVSGEEETDGDAGPDTPSEGRPGGGVDAEKEQEAQAKEQEARIRQLLEQCLAIEHISYTATFSSGAHEFVYEYYKREQLTKTVSRDGQSQSVTIYDGQNTLYFSLPEKTGYSLPGAGDDMDMVPGAASLLNDAVYSFRLVGEEKQSGLLCQVVETEDEYGVLKIWISTTLGLPVKYIGADANGWYSLVLTEIQTGEQEASLFVVPEDVVMYG